MSQDTSVTSDSRSWRMPWTRAFPRSMTVAVTSTHPRNLTAGGRTQSATRVSRASTAATWSPQTIWFRTLSEWIQRWAQDGAIVASACTGAFLVAEAGLLDGRAATTHWVAADSFRARYPTVELTVARIVVDTGAVITSGGSTTAFNLV